MATLADGESVEVLGDSGKTYIIKRIGAVYSCNCPAWLFQSKAIEDRTCKHLVKYLGEDAERTRLHLTHMVRSAPVPVITTKEKWIPPVMLAETWDGTQDLSGWLMSEKLDGIRAYWDGSAFWTRAGSKIAVPDGFAEGLPTHPLDGEMWTGRNQFQLCSSILRKKVPNPIEWVKVEYRIFDRPDDTHHIPFRDRVQMLNDWYEEKHPPHASVLLQIPCENNDHLHEALAITIRANGEGVIVRDPESVYVNGRSGFMLKVKPTWDAEAKIIGYNDGKGKYTGFVGSFAMEMPNGKQFALNVKGDALRKRPPPVGTVVTYTYKGLTDDGIPRFAEYQRIRTDVSWADIVAMAKSAEKVVAKARGK